MNSQLKKSMAAYSAAYLDMIAGKFGGDSTLNEVRVMNCIFQAHLAGRNVGVSCVSRALGIPKSTVSRAVSNFRAGEWIQEVPSLWDSRRRFLRLTPKALDRCAVEKETLQKFWPRAA